MGRGEDGAELPRLPPVASSSDPVGLRGHRRRLAQALSVAPMLDCTNTHFRRLCRLVSRRTHLWTEMINQDAVIHAHAKNPDLLSTAMRSTP